MKKNIIYLVVLCILVGVAFYLVKKGKNTSVSYDKSMFQIKDTSAITAIFMADRGGKAVKLTKTGNIWKLQNGWEARPEAIKSMLDALATIEVYNAVPKSGIDGILKLLAVSAVKVEIFQGSEKSKTIYVGGPNPSNEGTYMLLEGEDIPMVCYIPGWQGYLTPRFFTSLEDWRKTSIGNFNPAQISAVSLQYFDKPALSFNLTLSGKTPLVTNYLSEVQNADLAMTQNYLTLFKDAFVEYFEYNNAKKDSILKLPIQATLSISSLNKAPFKVNFYRKNKTYFDLTQPNAIEAIDSTRYWFHVPSTDGFGSYQKLANNSLLWRVSNFWPQTPVNNP